MNNWSYYLDQIWLGNGQYLFYFVFFVVLLSISALYLRKVTFLGPLIYALLGGIILSTLFDWLLFYARIVRMEHFNKTDPLEGLNLAMLYVGAVFGALIGYSLAKNTDEE